MTKETVVITGEEVRAVSPEGTERTMGLGAVLEKIAPRRPDTCEYVLPDGVKAVLPGGNGVVVVHQTPPRVCACKWIAPDSPARFGPETVYRNVKIGLPYLIIFASFERCGSGALMLSKLNECFFANHPIRSLTDELLYPALLNCSRFESQRGKPLAWICTQHLDLGSLGGEPDGDRRLEESLGALRRHLLETGFNMSSEDHEGDSWFSATVEAKVDPRIESVETWEAATEKDPLFAIDVPWLPTGRTVGQIAKRVGARQGGARSVFTSSGDIARILFNQPGPRKAGEGAQT